MLFRTNAQSEAYEEALAEAGVPYVVQGAERFFERPEVRQAMVALRAATRRPPDEASLRADGGRRRWSRGRLAAGRAAGRWRRPGAVGGARRAGRAGRGTFGDRPRCAGRVHRGAGPAGRAAARADGGRGDPGQPALGQGPGVGRGLPGRPRRGHAAHHIREDARGGRGGAAPALRRDHPGPAVAVAVLRRRPHPGRAGSGARPGSCRIADPPTRRRARRERVRDPDGTRRRAHRHPCRVCGAALTEAVQRKLGRCATCPSTMDEELYGRLRQWRRGWPPRRACRRTWCSPTPR